MNNVQISVATPKGNFTGEFSKTDKIEDVIARIITEMGLDGGDSFDLVFAGNVLQPKQRPLVSFGIASGAALELVATGTGV